MQANTRCNGSQTRGADIPRNLYKQHQSRTKKGALLSQTSVSASQPQCDSVSPASMSGRQHTHHELTTHHSRHQLIDRRQLLVAVSTLVPLAAASQSSPAQAAAAGSSCQLQESVTGLQWCDLTVGEGQVPIKGAFTKVNYTAKLASNGAVFDSTYQRRQPLVFKVGECEMVQAFDVAILGAEDMPPMREGGQRLVVAPPGPMQRQGVKSLTWVTGLIQAIDDAGEPRTPEGGFNSTLVFEVELMRKRDGRG